METKRDTQRRPIAGRDCEGLEGRLSGQAATGGRGAFITFEGGDGTGKTTHMGLLARALEGRGHAVVCVREPGGTAIGERLRTLLLDAPETPVCAKAELLVFEAARAQVVHEVIGPALEKGSTVLCDRFTDSTLAYQAGGRGLSRSFIEAANAFAADGLVPDRTILLICGETAEAGLARATEDGSPDRFESLERDFHQLVRDEFASLARLGDGRIRVVSSDAAVTTTIRAVFRELADFFPWMGDESICDDAYFERLVDARQGAERKATGRAKHGVGMRAMGAIG